MTVPMISVIGWHNAGKTTFIEHLLKELKRRGLRVATIKHSREDFELDRPGTDTFRYAQAGSDVVAISAQHKIAFIERRAREMSLEEIVKRLPDDLDLVVLEGYKRATVPKIEVLRKGIGEGRIAASKELLALIVDEPEKTMSADVRCFSSTDASGVVDLLEAQGLIKRKRAGGEDSPCQSSS
jgi:molybdopterin-guanine dinucleotide biosynthesis protein MobB